MPGVIIQEGTKIPHQRFIGFLNSLLNDYVSSFWDDAVKNIIELSFIKQHKCFLQEMYGNSGRQKKGFITVLPTDSENYIIMLHDWATGEPYLYNTENVMELFTFNSEGVITEFKFNDIIPMYDANGVHTHDLSIYLDTIYGISSPIMRIKDRNSNFVLCDGLLDMDFEGRDSGTYMVENTPVDDLPRFRVINISKLAVTIDVPILSKLNLRYKIPASQSVEIPITEHSDYFFRKNSNLGSLKVKKV
tara:strand:+ start:21272 stop:22012 length:741 start_codon:yes stop_codon:yes gene_type:complete